MERRERLARDVPFAVISASEVPLLHGQRERFGDVDVAPLLARPFQRFGAEMAAHRTGGRELAQLALGGRALFDADERRRGNTTAGIQQADDLRRPFAPFPFRDAFVEPAPQVAVQQPVEVGSRLVFHTIAEVVVRRFQQRVHPGRAQQEVESGDTALLVCRRVDVASEVRANRRRELDEDRRDAQARVGALQHDRARERHARDARAQPRRQRGRHGGIHETSQREPIVQSDSGVVAGDRGVVHRRRPFEHV